VVILLKIMSFSLWILIMLSLIIGNRVSKKPKLKELSLYIEDKEDIEMVIRKALLKIKAEETLIIKEIGSSCPLQKKIIYRMIRKNPGIFYYSLIENGGFLY